MAGQNRQIGEHHWYVSVAGRVYGPFDDATLWSYVQEGRVTLQSLLSKGPAGPFAAATQQPQIAHWFKKSDTTHTKVAEPSVHLVMADIRSNQSMAFLQTLQSLGPVERIADSVWLLRTRLNLEEMRRTLGPTLSGTDTLFMLKANQTDYVDVNLSAEAKDRIQALFRQD